MRLLEQLKTIVFGQKPVTVNEPTKEVIKIVEVKTCSKCGKQVPIIEFTSKNSHYKNICDKCVHEFCIKGGKLGGPAAAKARNTKTIEPVKVDRKTCKKCGRTYHVSCFRLSNTTGDGLNEYCRQCDPIIKPVTQDKPKKCNKCGLTKESKDFYKYSNTCKTCHAKYQKEYRERHSEKNVAPQLVKQPEVHLPIKDIPIIEKHSNLPENIQTRIKLLFNRGIPVSEIAQITNVPTVDVKTVLGITV